MSGKKIRPTLGGRLFSNSPAPSVAAETSVDPTPEPSDDDENENGDENGDQGEEQQLNPRKSKRRYWRDPLTGTQREIWRPGDGDGDIEHDHFERKGPVAPLEKRWRLYQISPAGGFKHRIVEPPSNVILDDRALHEILESNIPRAQLSRRWSHDFSGQANVRHRRPHRGRPAYLDKQARAESEKFQHFQPSGKNAQAYYFTGEKNFQPVLYSELSAIADTIEEPDLDDDSDEGPMKPKQHNQYTAPELLVRNGAESASLTKGKYRPRVNTFLRRSPSPPWVKDRRRLFGGVGLGRAGPSAPSNSPFAMSFASALVPTGPQPSGESLWVEQEDELKAEDEEEEEILPSVFDEATATNSGPQDSTNDDDFEILATPGPSNKRPASSSFFAPRAKVPKEMGYIERLAAGIMEEDLNAEAEEQAIEVADPTPAIDSDRVAQLENELDAAKDILRGKDMRIEELKEQLEEMRAQVLMERSLIRE